MTPGYEGVEGLCWEVIDDGDGSIKGRYKTKEEAIEMAKAKGQSTKRIQWHGPQGVYRLRFPNQWEGKK